MSVLYCRPSDVITSSATLSLTDGAANASFPLTNLQDGKAHTVFKSTGTGATIRSTFGSPVTIEGLVLVYHKLAGATVTVTNAAGFSNGLTIPANSEDGHCIDPWEDYRDLANTTSNVWDIAITGAATVVVIGEILWVQTWRELEILMGATGVDAQPAIVQPTDYHPHANVYSMGTRVRGYRGSVKLTTLATALLSLHRDARGPKTPFPLILDSPDNDALYVHLATNVHQYVESEHRDVGVRDVEVEFIEALKGLPL